MSKTRLIALPCKISGGIVSDERAFEIVLDDGSCHVGVAPVYYFWNHEDRPLGVHEPAVDQEIKGKVAARLLDRENGTAIVSIPDGSVARIQSSTITARPTEVVIDVPVRP